MRVRPSWVNRSPNRAAAAANGPGPRTRTRLVVREAGTETDWVVIAAPVTDGPVAAVATAAGATAMGTEAGTMAIDTEAGAMVMGTDAGAKVMGTEAGAKLAGANVEGMKRLAVPVIAVVATCGTRTTCACCIMTFWGMLAVAVEVTGVYIIGIDCGTIAAGAGLKGIEGTDAGWV
jgi:hypothetical protein